jgi:RNA polymerase primary sigma factor
VRVSNTFENSYQSYINSIKCYPLLDFDQEQELACKTREGNREAREKLIRSNLRLVIKIAVRYYNPRYNLMDLIQEGNIGLMIAVDKFDHRRNLRFSTYSTWWIRHYIVRGILKKEFQINVPLRKLELLHRIERTIYEMVERLSRLPNIEELEEELRVKSKEIKDVLNYITPLLSLDSTVDSENGLKLMDIIGSEDYHPEKAAFKHQLAEYEQEILSSLIKRDAKILKYRYGFYNGQCMTLKNVAKIFKITPEAVRQIELKALRKIRMRHKDLKSFIIN